MQRYIKEHESPEESLIGLGSYLAGFVFEKSGDPQAALRYYDEALQYGEFESLTDANVRLGDQATYRTPRIPAILKRAATAPETTAPESTLEGQAEQAPNQASRANLGLGEDAELLVVISYGRVPAKVAKRIPIGLALTYAAGGISSQNHATANRLAAQGLVTWVNYPELGKAQGNYSTPQFSLDGKWQVLEGALAVDREVKKAWEEVRGSVVASAITRMITRVVAGEAVNQVAGGGIEGLLLSLTTQATMSAADTPDTRSWSTLPARVAIARLRVKPGTHWVGLGARGREERYKVTLKPGGWATVNLTVLR
jgi:hypothetical protein